MPTTAKHLDKLLGSLEERLDKGEISIGYVKGVLDAAKATAQDMRDNNKRMRDILGDEEA